MVKEISTKDLQKLISDKGDYTLLDIREKNELYHGVIPTSNNVPLTEFESALKLSDKDFKKRYGFSKFTKNDKLILYCRSGGRSTHASEFLNKLGYNVLNYKGSVLEWSKADKNVKAY